MDGYVRLWRKITEEPFYTNVNTCHLAIHLLIRARYKEGRVLFNGEELTLKIGQLIVGRKSLSEETGLSEQSVRTSLEILTTCKFITIQPTNRFSIIHIVKYGVYQKDNQQINQPSTSHQPATNQPSTTNNKDNNENNENKTHFNMLWNRYPRKEGSKSALRHYGASVRTAQDRIDIERALDNYIKDITERKVEKQFIKMGSTWFNNWRDYIVPIGEVKKDTSALEAAEKLCERNRLAKQGEKI